MTASQEETQVKIVMALERELMAMRRRQAQLTAWLDLTQKLPRLVNPTDERWRTCTIVVRELLAALQLQKVLFLESVSSVGRDGTSISLRVVRDPKRSVTQFMLDPADEAFLNANQAGMCNNGSQLTGLCSQLKLHQFLWYRMATTGERVFLFIAGHDAEHAELHVAFDESELRHFKTTGNQLELLFGNIALLREVQREKDALFALNVELEARVEARTHELVTANDRLADAVERLRQEEHRLADDIDQARLFQERILPPLPATDVVDFGAAYRPVAVVGGDIYDICELAPGRFRIFVADATGHGVQASMRTILIKTEYDRVKRVHTSPADTLGELSRRLYSLFPDGEVMCTGCCVDVTVDGAGADVAYANAVSPPLLLWSMNGTHEIYEAGSFLGIDESSWPTPHVFRMNPGDVLLSYTDGLCEQTNSEGETFERTLVSADPRAWNSAADGVGQLMHEFDAFRGTANVADDITVVAIRLARR